MTDQNWNRTVKRTFTVLKKGIVAIFFVLSCINVSLLTLWMVSIPLFSVVFKGKKGAIFALLQIQMRSILNPGIACSFSAFCVRLKWIEIFALSFYLIIKSLRLVRSKKNIKLIIFTVLFALEALTASLFLSSFPIVAAMKVFSWLVPYIAIVLGVSNTADVDWIRILNKWLGTLCLGSFFLLGSSAGIRVNGDSFQGLLNHPNLFGVVSTLFLAGIVYKTPEGAKKIVIILSTLFLIVLSRSRTALLSSVLLILIDVSTREMKTSERLFIYFIGASVILLFLLSYEGIIDNVLSVIFKGHYEDLFYSRRGQFAECISRIRERPFFGTGFNVPYIRGIKSYEFSFDLIVENGNLILAVLADTGFIGFFLFAAAYTTLFRMGTKKGYVLFFSPFLVSMGEMAFFSTNNFAIIIYLYFAVYSLDNSKEQITNKRAGNRSWKN